MSTTYRMVKIRSPEQDEIDRLKAENEALREDLEHARRQPLYSTRRDAERYRWLCDGNGYFMEEEMLCGHSNDKAEADQRIDQAMSKEVKP